MKYFLALFIYRLLLLLLSPLLVIVLFLRSRSNTAYRQRLAERFGFIKQNFQTHGIIIHAASVGEVLALKRLVEKLLQQSPNMPITFTTFTPTGSEQVAKLFGDRVQHCYLPLDICFSTWLFLQKLKPKMIIFMETEIWPNLVAQAKNKKIKMLIINGRISSASINQYKKLRWLIAPCLNRLDNILSQSSDNNKNFIEIGANSNICQLSGNIKYDMEHSTGLTVKQQELSALLPDNKKLWVVASTHAGDEDIALTAYTALLNTYPDLLLVIVPRHPERFSEAYALATKYGFITEKRSTKLKVDNEQQVWIVDSLGELMALYSLADIVTMGGSFSAVQGHNPLEPAWFKKPIIVGPNMANFSDIMSQMLATNALIQLSQSKPNNIENNAHLLTEAMSNILNDGEYAASLGNNAYHVVMNNQGAVNKTLTTINRLLE